MRARCHLATRDIHCNTKTLKSLVPPVGVGPTFTDSRSAFLPLEDRGILVELAGLSPRPIMYLRNVYEVCSLYERQRLRILTAGHDNRYTLADFPPPPAWIIHAISSCNYAPSLSARRKSGTPLGKRVVCCNLERRQEVSCAPVVERRCYRFSIYGLPD